MVMHVEGLNSYIIYGGRKVSLSKGTIPVRDKRGIERKEVLYSFPLRGQYLNLIVERKECLSGFLGARKEILKTWKTLEERDLEEFIEWIILDPY
jgi:hypothetical protein